MSQFGEVVRSLRRERGLTLEVVADKIGSHKGYISGIENGKVSPPSVRLIRKLAKTLGADEKRLVRIAWVDKAPKLIRDDAKRFLEWMEAGDRLTQPKHSTAFDANEVDATRPRS